MRHKQYWTKKKKEKKRESRLKYRKQKQTSHTDPKRRMIQIPHAE